MPKSRTKPRVRVAAWLPGLDGLRAIAVIGVVAYHVLQGHITGGFLGVDLFFAISGYLITRLLLIEMADTGGLGLFSFWVRRWRRLVPAVVALLIVLSLGGALVWRDQLPFLRSGVLASIGYSTNWWLIFAHHPYFVTTGRPPMIQHLWSLAIEEQFYLLWPLVLVGITSVALRLRRRGGRDGRGWLPAKTLTRVAIISVVLAAGSALAMALLAIHSDVPYGADPSRIYYGTDTHATALLLGAAFGALSVLGHGRPAQAWHRPGWMRLRGWLIDLVAAAALVYVGYRMVTTNYYDPQLYRTGFASFAVAASVLVAGVARRGSLLARALELAPLRWIGKRSYSIYLWYWPVVVVTRPGLDVSGPKWLLAINQVVIIVLLAMVSYRFIERPFRTGAAGRWLGGLPAATRTVAVKRWPRWAQQSLAASLTVAVLVAVFAATQNRQEARAAGAPPTTAPTSIAYVPPSTPATSAPPSTPAPSRPTSTVPRPSHRTSKTTVRHKPATSGLRPATVTVSAFGDSVMLGAAPALVQALPHASVFAVEGRQARAVFNDIADRRSSLGQVVVIHAGDNGMISPDDLCDTLRSLRGEKRVVLVNDRVPRDWESPNNATLTKVAKQFDNVVLIDWHDVSGRHKDWFWNDGIHLRPDGASAYAQLIRNAITRR